MSMDIEAAKKRLRLKKMDTHIDEMEIQKLILLEKIEKLDSEIQIAKEQKEELAKEIGE